MNRRALERLFVHNRFTYTLETIIQAGRARIPLLSVPIRTNHDLRPSRLVKSIPSYVRRSLVTIVRIYMTYQPFQFFAYPGFVFFLGGFLISLRFLFYHVTSEATGHVQSLILAALLMGIGFFLGVIGLIADLISVNRKLLEKIEFNQYQLNVNSKASPAVVTPVNYQRSPILGDISVPN